MGLHKGRGIGGFAVRLHGGAAEGAGHRRFRGEATLKYLIIDPRVAPKSTVGPRYSAPLGALLGMGTGRVVKAAKRPQTSPKI